MRGVRHPALLWYNCEKGTFPIGDFWANGRSCFHKQDAFNAPSLDSSVFAGKRATGKGIAEARDGIGVFAKRVLVRHAFATMVVLKEQTGGLSPAISFHRAA
jgi:hypothetical protein